jgi:hypothetical protein
VPESTLALKLTDLQGEVGWFLGWGRGPDNDEEAWTPAKQRDIKSCVETCLRNIYFQASVDPRDTAYQWSFLRPAADIPFLTGTRSSHLPDDFGGFEGEFAVSRVTSPQGGLFMPVPIVSEAQLDERYAMVPSATGRPIMAAERILKGTTATRSSRSELYVYPQATEDYTLRVRYSILPDYLTSLNPFPYGGAAHAETFKAAARAAAELFLDNQPGPENANYLRALAASINYDRRHQPKTLGKNYDRSDWRRGAQFGREGWMYELGYLGPTTFNGVLP